MYTAAKQTSPPNSKPASQDSVFFTHLALFITVVIFGGFAINWIANPEQLGRVTLWIGLHAAFSAAWYLLLLHQLRLSRIGNISAHKLWGKLSVVLVVAIVITGAIMALELYGRLVSFGVFNPTDAAARVRAGGLIGGTFLQWAIFVALYVLGLLNIKSPAHHKRFMLASAIQMMPEGLNRLIHLVGLPGYSMLLIIFVVYLAIVAYDWKTDNRIHWSTLTSLGLFFLLATMMYTVFRSQVWGDWVVSMLSGI